MVAMTVSTPPSYPHQGGQYIRVKWMEWSGRVREPSGSDAGDGIVRERTLRVGGRETQAVRARDGPEVKAVRKARLRVWSEHPQLETRPRGGRFSAQGTRNWKNASPTAPNTI